MAEGTLFWGVQVERVEVKDVRVPEQLMRAMAAEAEAAREARAKVIAAEGEHKSSRALMHAAENIVKCPVALQVVKNIKVYQDNCIKNLKLSCFLLEITWPQFGRVSDIQVSTHPLLSSENQALLNETTPVQI